MKKQISYPSFFTFFILAMFAFSVEAQRASSKNVSSGSLLNRNRASAQMATAAGAAGAAQEGDVRIKLPAPRASLSEAPEFNFNAKVLPRLNNKKREWALFEIEYDTRDKWMDQLAFTYHVLTQGRDEETGSSMFNYYTVTVRYIDVPKGKHRSCVAIPPSQLERYGQPVALGLEVAGKTGEVIASDSASSGINLPKEWWKSDNVMNNSKIKVERRTGLVDRSKTPFALINPDDYEVVQ